MKQTWMEQIRSGLFFHRIVDLFMKKLLPGFYYKNCLIYASKIRYWKRVGKKLDLTNPQDINQKLHWLALYDDNPLKIQASDKYAVRSYLKERGCEEIQTRLYGVYSDASEIDFDKLPKQFVLKCTHGCGYNILCPEKEKLNVNKTKKQLNKWLKEKFGRKFLEVHYDKIEPRIICEEYLNFSNQSSVVDYKIHCINGEPFSFLICAERTKKGSKLKSYSIDWKPLDLLVKEGGFEIEKPEKLEEMLEYARKLSAPFPYVRVDFYYVNNRIYFGELTFTPFGNIMTYYKDSVLQLMGEKLKLTNYA